MGLVTNKQPKEATKAIGIIRDYVKNTTDGQDLEEVRGWINKVEGGEPAQPFIDLLDLIAYKKSLHPLGLLLLEEIKRMTLLDLVKAAGRRMYFHLALSVHSRLAGTTIRENILGGAERQFKTIQIGLEKVHPDFNITIFPDLAPVVEPFGGKVETPEDQVPMVVEHPIKSREDLHKLNNMDMSKAGRFLETMKTIQMFTDQYTFLKCSVAAGPFSLAGFLIGAEQIARMTIKDPDFVKTVLDFSVGLAVMGAKTQIELGAEIVLVGDPTASLLSPKAYQTFAAEYTRKVIEQIERPVILHVCGQTSHIIEMMCATGAQGISVDLVDLPAIVSRVPSDVVIIGNISPVGTLLNGTAEEVRKETKDLLDKMRDVPNYILATGCEIPLETPYENMMAMVETVKNYH